MNCDLVKERREKENFIPNVHSSLGTLSTLYCWDIRKDRKEEEVEGLLLRPKRKGGRKPQKKKKDYPSFRRVIPPPLPPFHSTDPNHPLRQQQNKQKQLPSLPLFHPLSFSFFLPVHIPIKNSPSLLSSPPLSVKIFRTDTRYTKRVSRISSFISYKKF